MVDIMYKELELFDGIGNDAVLAHILTETDFFVRGTDEKVEFDIDLILAMDQAGIRVAEKDNTACFVSKEGVFMVDVFIIDDEKYVNFNDLIGREELWEE